MKPGSTRQFWLTGARPHAAVLLGALLAATSCSTRPLDDLSDPLSPAPPNADEGPGDVTLQTQALLRMPEVPAGVACMRIVAHGSRTVVYLMNVIPGEPTSLSAAGLPTGPVSFVAEAFSRSCAELTVTDQPEWRSLPYEETLVPGVTVVLNLVLRRNGVAEVSFAFESAVDCTPGGDDCADDELCFVLSCGDGTGGCLPRPQACTQQYAPVCGCDGVTYANECEAAAAGRSIAHDGACACGGPGNVACPQGYFCAFEPGTCGAADREGTCAAPAVACPQLAAPVCGCDGKTYENACAASAAAQSIDHEGACVPQVCGGPERIACGSAGLFCAHPDGTCADPDRFGVCKERPRSCPTVLFAPVCACNGKTYTNECLAHAVAQSLASRGACPLN